MLYIFCSTLSIAIYESIFKNRTMKRTRNRLSVLIFFSLSYFFSINFTGIFISLFLKSLFFVNEIDSFCRDIVMIDYAEKEIINSLKKIKRIAIDNYGTQKWIGITSK